MNTIHGFILGIVQGLTEFLPVSSTAHLLIFQRILNLPPDDRMFSFLVIVQIGTVAALMIYFWKELFALIKAFFQKPFSSPDNKLAWYIIIATIPSLIAGYFLKDLVETLFRSPLLEAGIRLLITAIVISIAEVLSKKSRGLEKITWMDALIIGLAQVISVFPGASRSGTTISAGMLLNFNRQSAARFAFLMSIPVMLAAGGYQILEAAKAPGISSFLPILIIGFLTAGIVGWLAVKWLLGYLNHHSLYVFAIYCAIVGIICIGLNILHLG